MNAKRSKPLRVDVMLDGPTAPQSARAAKGKRSTKGGPKRSHAGDEVDESARKRKVSFYLPDDLMERLRDTADALSGPPERATVSGIAADALDRELRRLEKKHNGGERFPQRPAELRPGRKANR